MWRLRRKRSEPAPTDREHALMQLRGARRQTESLKRYRPGSGDDSRDLDQVLRYGGMGGGT